jgi:hypothetical protein
MLRRLSLLATMVLLPIGGLLQASSATSTPSIDALPGLRGEFQTGALPLPGAGPSPQTHDNLAVDDWQIVNAACNYVDPKGFGVRPSLTVGMNNWGTFGSGPTGLSQGVGFQMPSGASQESLDIAWRGEKWVIDFGFGPRSYGISDGLQGPAERVDDYLVDSGRWVRYLVTVFLPLEKDASNGSRDGVLVDFEFVVDKSTCDVVLRTTIENQAPFDLTISYKRIVDWDVWKPTFGSFVNCWQNLGPLPGGGARAWVPIGGPPSNPFDCNAPVQVECRTTPLGVNTDLTDLYAWDDLFVAPPNAIVQSLAPITGDYNAGFHWQRNIDSFDQWTTFLKYECTKASTIISNPVDPVLDAVDEVLRSLGDVAVCPPPTTVTPGCIKP